MQHWPHQTRCSRGGATTTFIFITFNFISFKYASPVPKSVETDPLETHCNPPDGGIRAVRRSATAFEGRRTELVLRCDPVRKELASCTCGNGRRDTNAYRQIWMIEKYAYRKFLTPVTVTGDGTEHTGAPEMTRRKSQGRPWPLRTSIPHLLRARSSSLQGVWSLGFCRRIRLLRSRLR